MKGKIDGGISLNVVKRKGIEILKLFTFVEESLRCKGNPQPKFQDLLEVLH